MQKTLRLLTTLLLLCAYTMIWSQSMLKGSVREGGSPMPGVAVQVKGSNAGMTTDANGEYAIKLANGTYEVVYSFIGFNTVTRSITIAGSDVTADVSLESSSTELDAVVISTGSRNSQRTVTDSPLPIDILSAKDLASTGQMRMDQALQYRVPSFNTVNTPVNDATTLLDPYEIRNMGPSRTLILINGKRKNLSSLLYVQFSPGRGETGVDVSAIPMEAVKRVEILRDGASAQYGSDAIAGVMNFILKDKYDYTSLNVNAGVTAKGDGATYGISLNSGGNIGSKGFINYTLGFNQQDNAIRSGKIDVPTEIATFGNAFGSYKNDDGTPSLDKFKKETGIRFDETPINPKGANATLADVTAWNATGQADNNAKYNTIITNFLTDNPTGGNLNGTGEITSARFLVNAGTSFGETGLLYANAALVSKRVLSNANYRVPYWRQDRGLLHKPTDNGGKNYIQSASQLAFSEDGKDLYKGYVGYMPTFEGDLLDYNATIGAKNEVNGWNTDLSLTTGGNTQSYTVDNTVNRSFGKASPTRFKPGGFGFNHLVGNLDVSKAVTDKFNVAFGAEARSETYTIVAGDTASYKGQGSNSFPGIDAVNAGSNSRFNLGAYVDLSYDITKDFLINGTFRTEKYSDFGPANVYKISSRYKLADDKITLRGSYSTGFRAPSLHQIYAQSIQASFAGGVIQTSGLYNNRSAEAKALGIPTLKPENSTNISLGAGLNLTKDLSVTLDYYNINVKDRIVYSSSISSDKGQLGAILKAASLVSVQFFVNGIETSTSGLDFIVAQKNLQVGSGKLAINLAGNYMLNNEIVGSPNEPQAIKDAGSSILNEQIKSLLTESRPQYKAILGFDYSVGKILVNLNSTLFGSTSFRDFDNGGGAMADIKAVFAPAVVTDLSIGYRFTDKVAFSLNVNNLLNVIPKWDLEASSVSKVAAEQTASAARAAKILNDPAEKSLLRGFLGFSGRYDILGYNGSQFSQLGTVFNANLNVKF
jgi:iron complex outermembrane recepter protein